MSIPVVMYVKNTLLQAGKVLLLPFIVLFSSCMSNNMLLHKLEKEDADRNPTESGSDEVMYLAGYGGFDPSFNNTWSSPGEGFPLRISVSSKKYINDYIDIGAEHGPVNFQAFVLFRPYKSNSLFPEILSLTKAGFDMWFYMVGGVGVSAEKKLALSFNITDWLNIKLGGSLRVWSFDLKVAMYECDFDRYSIDGQIGEGAYFVKGLFAGIDIMISETVRLHLSLDYFIYTMLRPNGQDGAPIERFQNVPDAISISTGVAF